MTVETLPARASDAGPVDAAMDWDEWLAEAMIAMRDAMDTRMVRDVTLALDRAAECLARAREEWERN